METEVVGIHEKQEQSKVNTTGRPKRKSQERLALKDRRTIYYWYEDGNYILLV